MAPVGRADLLELRSTQDTDHPAASGSGHTPAIGVLGGSLPDQDLHMEVRPATPADVPMIAQVHVSTWRVAYRGQVPDALLDQLSVESRVAAWSHIVLQDTSWPSRGALVAQDHAGRVVGFAHISNSRDEDAGPEVGEVTAVYVAPDSWRRGAGRALLNAAGASLRAAGFSRATLWVLATNQPACGFYERLGWVKDGAVKLDHRSEFELRELRYTADLV